MSRTKKNRKQRKNQRKTRHRHYLGRKCAMCTKDMRKGMKGGNCSSCTNHLIANQSGGNFYKPAAPIPGPFVGHSWNPPVKDWPGVNGVGGDRNYLAYNNYPTDPQTAMRLNGGRRKRSKRRGRCKKGGNSLSALIPQDLVNLGRDVSFNMGSAFNAINGYKAPINPLPYKDQFYGSERANIRSLMKTI